MTIGVLSLDQSLELQVSKLWQRRGDDPNVIMESLFERVITNNSVTILPESKAPKYLQELDEGEVKELGK